MGMSLTHIDYIFRYIGLDYEDRILVTSDIEAFTLAYCIELCSIVSAYYLAVWILLIAGLLDMFAAASVCFSFKPDIITHRFRQTE